MRKGIITAFFLAIASTHGAPACSATAPVTIYGTITAPTCSINKEGPIDVNYGTLNMGDIATSKGTKTTRIPFSCAGVMLELTIYGAGAAFNDDYAKTNIDGLAVKFTDEDNNDIPLNTTLNVDTTLSYMDVRTVLMKKAGADLRGGAFNTSVTLLFKYS